MVKKEDIVIALNRPNPLWVLWALDARELACLARLVGVRGASRRWGKVTLVQRIRAAQAGR